MSGRGLDEVLHYFISEEEQAEARSRARKDPGSPSPPPLRWGLATDPRRPLSCALALDLAAALAGSGHPARILAAFPAHPLLRRGAGVPWQVVEALDEADLAEAVQEALEDEPHGLRTLIVFPPESAAPLLQRLPPPRISGLIIPVEAANWGLARALAVLRQLPGATRSLRIGALLLDPGDAGQARSFYRKLVGAAQRQLGLELEDLGSLKRDPASFRSLLYGASVLEVDAESAPARDLRAVGRRLESVPVSAGV